MVWASHDSDIACMQDLKVKTDIHRTLFRLYRVMFNKVIFQLKLHSVTWQKIVKKAIGYVSLSIFFHYQRETDSECLKSKYIYMK